MKQRWIRKSRISNTSHHRPAPHSGTPERQPPFGKPTLKALWKQAAYQHALERP